MKEEIFNAVKQLAEEQEAKAIIRKDGPSKTPYCVYSETTGRNFGCYGSKKQAETRLNQIKMFKHMKENK